MFSFYNSISACLSADDADDGNDDHDENRTISLLI
jgi:hypothetical protein